MPNNLKFLQKNGMANGDTTKRSEVFRAYQLSIKEDDHLKGTWSFFEKIMSELGEDKNRYV